MEDGEDEWVVNHKQRFLAANQHLHPRQKINTIAEVCGQIPAVDRTDDLFCFCKSVRNDCKANVYLRRVQKIKRLCCWCKLLTQKPTLKKIQVLRKQNSLFCFVNMWMNMCEYLNIMPIFEHVIFDFFYILTTLNSITLKNCISLCFNCEYVKAHQIYCYWALTKVISYDYIKPFV